MPKKFKITEEQYRRMMDEGVAPNGVTLQAPVKGNGIVDGNQLKRQVDETPNVKAISVNPNDVKNGTSEHRIVTKKQLQEERRRYLKENSELLSLNSFFKRLKS